MSPGESRNTIIKGVGAVIVIVFILYAYFETRNLITGPRISLKEPENGALIISPVISFSGVAKNVVKLSLNGRPISIDEKGNFQELVALQGGYNVASLYGEDRFGKGREVIIELVRKE